MSVEDSTGVRLPGVPHDLTDASSSADPTLPRENTWPKVSKAEEGLVKMGQTTGGARPQSSLEGAMVTLKVRQRSPVQTSSVRHVPEVVMVPDRHKRTVPKVEVPACSRVIMGLVAEAASPIFTLTPEDISVHWKEGVPA